MTHLHFDLTVVGRRGAQVYWLHPTPHFHVISDLFANAWRKYPCTCPLSLISNVRAGAQCHWSQRGDVHKGTSFTYSHHAGLTLLPHEIRWQRSHLQTTSMTRSYRKTCSVGAPSAVILLVITVTKSGASFWRRYIHLLYLRTFWWPRLHFSALYVTRFDRPSATKYRRCTEAVQLILILWAGTRRCSWKFYELLFLCYSLLRSGKI